MHVDKSPFYGRCGRSVRIDSMFPVNGIRCKYKDVTKDRSGLIIKTQGIHLLPVIRGRADPDLLAQYYGRGPSLAVDGSFPNDVRVGRPADRGRLHICYTVKPATPEMGPVFFGRLAGNQSI